ncbi:MAG TPA: alkaline phosphatase family protein [Nitriliruptorales bacterium]|nr:alkaline phosphatase family protein [Nitriliruptorales bacterium]
MNSSSLPAGPRYGNRSLADLARSVLVSVGLNGRGTATGQRDQDGLQLPTAPRLCLLLLDGLGWELLQRHGPLAPFLTAAARSEPLDAAFPTTTVASLGSLATGRAPGEHGLVGATVALPWTDRPMSLLGWKLHGVGDHVPLVDREPPQEVQPCATVFERAAAAGLRPVAVGPSGHADTGLSQAVLRGAVQVAVDDPSRLATTVIDALAGSTQRLVYAYHGALDQVGHAEGTGSAAWRAELARADALVAALAARLPPGALLVVTGDHGMVDVSRGDQVDVADTPGLLRGVRVVAGEPRCRHVHAHPGAQDDVLAAWRARLGAAATVVTRAQAVASGWFGPRVTAAVEQRIGDVVVAARGRLAITNKRMDPHQREMVGHHGGLTRDELLVPLVILES